MLEALFGWWEYDFMRRAFFAVLLIMPLFSLLGTLVVNNGMAFFSDAPGPLRPDGGGDRGVAGAGGPKPGHGGLRGGVCAADEPHPAFSSLLHRYGHRRFLLLRGGAGVGAALPRRRLLPISKPAYWGYPEHFQESVAGAGGHAGNRAAAVAALLQPLPRGQHKPGAGPQQGHRRGWTDNSLWW